MSDFVIPIGIFVNFTHTIQIPIKVDTTPSLTVIEFLVKLPLDGSVQYAMLIAKVVQI